MKRFILVVAVLVLGLFIGNSLAVEVTLFGPKQYSRTAGKPNVYADTFPGTSGQGKLILKNGTQAGKNRISSALVLVNGKQVLGPSDFNQQVYNKEVPIKLSENNSISVELRSGPGGNLTIQVVQQVAADAAAVIGPEGGTVEVTDPSSPIYRAKVVIPEGAVSEDVIISIQPVFENAIPPLPGGSQFLGGLDLKPDGLEFSQYVEASIPISSVYNEGTPIPIVSYDYSQQEYYFATAGTATVFGNIIEAEIYHFSRYIATTSFSCKCSGSSVNLRFPLPEAYWRVHTYDGHVPNYDYRYAADFWYAQTQGPDVFDYEVEAGRNMKISAAHGGRVFLYAVDITGIGGNGPSIEVKPDSIDRSISISPMPETSFKFTDKNTKERTIDLELLVKENKVGGNEIVTNYTHLKINRKFVVPEDPDAAADPEKAKQITNKIKTAIEKFYNGDKTPYAIDTGINVTEGQEIGSVSDYGHAFSGPHLHFMVYVPKEPLIEGSNASLGVPCRLDNEDIGEGAKIEEDFILNNGRGRPRYLWDGKYHYEYSAMPRNHFKPGEIVTASHYDPEKYQSVNVRSTPGGTVMYEATNGTIGNISGVCASSGITCTDDAICNTQQGEKCIFTVVAERFDKPGDYHVWWRVEYDTHPGNPGWTASEFLISEESTFSAPSLTAPGLVLTGSNYTISWTISEYATRYVVQESLNTSFTDPSIFYVTETSMTFSHSVSTSTNYYYRVAAENESCGLTSDWSNTAVTRVANPHWEEI
jgi:hypothetical protein